MSGSNTDLAQLDDAIAVAARTDIAIFAEYVLTDEENGSPVLNAPCHDKWHRLADKHDRMVLLTNVESGKTQTITIARALHALGTNPKERILIVSKTKEQAAKIVNALRGYIERSSELHKVFPHLKPGPLWRYDSFNIDQGANKGIQKDWNVQSCGMDGSVLGARYGMILIDDLIDFQNTFTEYQRTKTVAWLTSTVFGRLIRGGKIIFIANAWDENDAAHVLGNKPTWTFERSGVVLIDGFNSAMFMAMGTKERERLPYAWRERWDPLRIQRFIEDFGPTQADRQLFAITPKAGSALFHRKWIVQCYDTTAIPRRSISADEIPAGARIVVGVDLASRKGKKSDRTVLFAIMIHPPEPGLKRGKKQLLWIEAGKWGSPEIKTKILEYDQRYSGPLFVVEDNAAQIYVKQDLAVDAPWLKVHSHTTTAKKWHPSLGLGGLAAEFEVGGWIIPAEHAADGTLAPCRLVSDGEGSGRIDEISQWILEMLTCDPKTHTGDTLMASFFAREGARSPNFEQVVEFSATEEELLKAQQAARTLHSSPLNTSTPQDERPLAGLVAAATRPEAPIWRPEITGKDELAEIVGKEAAASLDNLPPEMRDKALAEALAAARKAPDVAEKAKHEAARKAREMELALARFG